MNRPPDPPAYGLLIEAARKKTGISVREAAKRAGISDAWWRYVVRGYQNLSGGGYGPMSGPADTVAAMARVVGVSPERLESEGQRPDAAEAMRSSAPPVRAAPPHAEPGEPDDAAWKLFPASPEKRALWRLRDGDGNLLPERIRAELIAALDEARREALEENENGGRGMRAGLGGHEREKEGEGAA